MNPLADQGIRLGSPAISAAPEGGQWLADFMAACSDCKIDFIAFHWCVLSSRKFICSLLQFLISLSTKGTAMVLNGSLTMRTTFTTPIPTSPCGALSLPAPTVTHKVR
jgi:hypothetical protein